MTIPIELIAVVLTVSLFAIGYLFKQMIDTRQRLAMCETETQTLKQRSDSSADTEKTVARMTEAVENLNKRLDRIERLLDELNRKR